MTLDLFQIDAFTNSVFGGNPACVVPLTSWLPDETLLKITQENAVAETAFFVAKKNKFHLRWFTPEIEMDLWARNLSNCALLKNNFRLSCKQHRF